MLLSGGQRVNDDNDDGGLLLKAQVISQREEGYRRARGFVVTKEEACTNRFTNIPSVQDLLYHLPSVPCHSIL